MADNVTARSKCKRFVQEVKTDLARQGLMDLGEMGLVPLKKLKSIVIKR